MFFGNGLGDASTFSKSLHGASSESFLIQLLYETGALGMVVFLIPYFKLILKRKHNFKFLFIFFILVLISPAFYGISINFLVYPILIYQYLLTNNFISNFNNESRI